MGDAKRPLVTGDPESRPWAGTTLGHHPVAPLSLIDPDRIVSFD